MDANSAFAHWTEQQQKLRHALVHNPDQARARALFLSQHAMLHRAALAPGAAPWSFPDALLSGLGEPQLRQVAGPLSQSIAWLLWHMARTEDAALNLVLAGTPQVLDTDGWHRRLGVPARDIGTAMSNAEVAELSARVDLAALDAYRLAVGQRTRAIVAGIEPAILRQQPDPARIQAVLGAGALAGDAHGIADYWARHPLYNLLLMPATRHPMTHLNAALRIAQKLRRV